MTAVGGQERGSAPATHQRHVSVQATAATAVDSLLEFSFFKTYRYLSLDLDFL